MIKNFITKLVLSKLICLISILLLIFSCVTNHSNVIKYKINSHDIKKLLAIKNSNGWSLGYVDDKNHLNIIRTRMDCMEEFCRISLSPSKKNFILTTCGEGSFFYSIYDINDLILANIQGKESLSSDRTLDPYPTGLWELKWINDECIEFTTDANMAEFDYISRRGEYNYKQTDGLFTEKVWRWNLVTDKFKMINSKDKGK